MKKFTLSKFQSDLIRSMFVIERFETGDLHDEIGGAINDKLLNYSPFIIFMFTDEELGYLKLRLNTISELRKLDIAKIRKEPIKKIESTIFELKKIFN